MSLRLSEVVASLSATDPRLVGSTLDALHRSVLAEGFNRFATTTGVRIHRDKAFPASFLPLVQVLVRLLSGDDIAAIRSCSHILSLLCRASKAFSRWVYTVPKFAGVYLKVIRGSVLSDQEMAMRMLKTLQHIVSLEKKACLVLRLEGAIKLLMACVGNGGGGASNVAPTMRTATPQAASDAATHSTSHQKLLRILVELLLVIIKCNEHNSTALVSQSLPHISNLLCVLRNQQGHVKIFQTTLQIFEKLCKEKKVLHALLGTAAPASADPAASASTTSAPASTPAPSAVPVNSVAVQSLLSALGPGVPSFMTWCMVTLLNSRFEVLNVLLRLIFQLAGSKIGFATLVANGGVESLLPAIQGQLHSPSTVRAVTALIWQQQRQAHGHLVPKVDPLYQFHSAGLQVHFTKDGRVLTERAWQTERDAAKAAKAAGTSETPSIEVAEDESLNERAPASPSFEVTEEASDLELMAASMLEAELPTFTSDIPEPASSPSLEVDTSISISLSASLASPLPLSSTVPDPDDESGLPMKESDDDDDGPDTAQAKPTPPADDEGAKSSDADSDGDADDADSADERSFKKKPTPTGTIVKKADAPSLPSSLPTVPLTPGEIEKVKVLLAQAIAASSSSPPLTTADSSSSSTTPPPASSVPAVPKLGLGPDDAEFAWGMSPELWDPEAPATALRVAADLAEVRQPGFDTAKSVQPFVQSTPPVFFDDNSQRRPGIPLNRGSEPLADLNPMVLIDKMRSATQRFTNPASFLGRVVYDRDAGGSLVHLLAAAAASAAASPTPSPVASELSTPTATPTPSPSVPAATLSPASSPSPTLALTPASLFSASPPPLRASSVRSSPILAPSSSPSASPQTKSRRLPISFAPKTATPSAPKTAFGGVPKSTPSSGAKLSLDGSKKVLSAGRASIAAKAAPTLTSKRPASSTTAIPAATASPAPASSATAASAAKAAALKRRATAPAMRVPKGLAPTPVATSSSGPSSTTSSKPAPVPKPAKVALPPPPPLVFESRFESGNLHRVIQSSDTEYDLVLSTDVNSRGHTQWFMFSVRGAVPGVKYQFSMLNLEKSHSTFNTGMKPVMHSQRMLERDGIGWHRALHVDEVAYFRNVHSRPYEDAASRSKPAGTARQDEDADDEEENDDDAKEAADEGAEKSTKKKVSIAKSSGRRVLKKKSSKKGSLPSSPLGSAYSSAAPSRSSSPPPQSQPRAMIHSPVQGAGRAFGRDVSPPPTSTGAELATAIPAVALHTTSMVDDVTSSLESTGLTGLGMPATARSTSEGIARPVTSPFGNGAVTAPTTARASTAAAPHSALIEFDMTAPKKRLVKKKSSASSAKPRTARGKSEKGEAGGTSKKKVAKKAGKKHETFYTLSFCMTFPYADDTVFLAYHVPFTYSFQRECLDALQSSSALAASCLRRQKLTLTRGGNLCELLTITDFARNRTELESVKRRKLVVLSARIHPGESNASWIMKGLLEFLCGPTEAASWLRQNIVFKIVPMLNCDGVIEGNYRSSLSGVDLNRHWHAPSPIVHPTIFYTRKLLLSLSVHRSLLLFCDFHGHSAMKNMCIYGCDLSKGDGAVAPPPIAEHLHFAHVREALTLATPQAASSVGLSSATNGEGLFASAVSRRSTLPAPAAVVPFDSSPPANPLLAFPAYLNESARAVLASPLLLELRAAHVFPELLARRSDVGGRYFNHGACAFSVRKEKAGTARVAFWRALRTWDVFTFEASFAGGTIGDMKGQHFQPAHYEDMGGRFVDTIREFVRVRRDKAAAVQAMAWNENAKPQTTIPTPNSIIGSLPPTL